MYAGSECVQGSIICPPSVLGIIQGGLNIIFATFLAIQARRIRFVFDDTSFELKNTDSDTSESDAALESSGENFVVGGANRWDYDSFVNWDFFPNEQFPILVYFKENQTPEVRNCYCIIILINEFPSFQRYIRKHSLDSIYNCFLV